MSTARRGLFTLTSGTLVPVGDHSRALLNGVKDGDCVMVQIRRARYPEHHRLAFAVFHRLAEATGMTIEAIVLWLKWETGHCDLVRLPNGRTMASPKSISFENMDQTEFQTWWNTALEIIKDKMLHKLPAKQFREIRDLIAGDRKAA